MSSDHNLCFPSDWTAPHKKILVTEERDELNALNELLLWVNETGVCTEEEAKTTFKKINAYFYIRYLYPIPPDDLMSKKLFQLETQFTVVGYIVDDVVENYNENEMKEFISSYNFLQSQSLEKFPKFPSISEMRELVSYVQKAYTKNAVVAYVDYINKTTSVLYEGGKLTKDTLLDFRTRLSNAFVLFFDAMLSNKKKTECSEGEFLWRRCFDGTPTPMYMFTEVYSKILEKNHVLPLDLFYKLYLLGSFFSAVLNDLYSYERDKSESTVKTIIKIWFHENTVEDIKAATLKISKILNAALQQMYLLVEEVKTRHPEISEWFQGVVVLTVGWIHIHHTVVPRYASSSIRITPVGIESDMISDWLLEKVAYGQQKVQELFENINDPSKKTLMDFLHGFAFELIR